MWFWAISAIASSILGSASSSWFEKTAMGRWFYKKIDNLYNWAADRYGLKVLKSEDKWRKKYPNIASKMDDLEERLNRIEKMNDNKIELK
jgi:hypothetical protein